ncbi:hypothetical protein VPG91_29850 [Nitrospirillum amazonense]|uniref:hypothetical protein n=1 Tax=Nitrospirillum amazonense TaxID=28077 RepID=UPI002DD421EB|nr:hypothetical protein [Nitrospirillum amazonense]MEC4595231.1 hypothetical protein [Nitrospirillum amazonense]
MTLPATSGRGVNEMLARVAAFAAQETAGDAAVSLDFYEAIDGWIAGMAMMVACLPLNRAGIIG